MDAVSSLVEASRGLNVSADGDLMDVRRSDKGKGMGKGHEKGKKEFEEGRTRTQLTTGRKENVSTVRTRDALQGTVRRASAMRKPRDGQHRDSSKGNQRQV